MKNEYVYLTFKTDKEISKLLTMLAHAQGTTQPDLINQLCINYINEIDEIAKRALQEKGYIN